MIERITQSFIKDMRSYKEGDLCGNIVRERWINDQLIEDPDREPGAMELGAYFEFIAFGTLPKNNKIPQPVYMKRPWDKFGHKPENLKVEDMEADYRNAHANKDHLLRYLDDMGFEILHRGKRIVKGRCEGTIDLICRATKDIDGFKAGDLFVIDIKYSKLLGKPDRWNKHGWAWSDVQTKYHGTQAKQYNFVSDLPVYFLVTNAANGNGECKFFFTPVSEWESEQHLIEGNALLEDLKFFAPLGLTPRPNLITCNKCPLRAGCADRLTTPKVQFINLTTE